MQCRICNLDEESERHLIQCTEVLKKMDEDFNFTEVDYLDIFSQNLDNQITITKIFEKIMKVKLLHSNSE